jgi:Ribonuclease G/E
MELDFEAVLDGKQALDRQLQPAKHAVGLLKAEKDRMEKELEKDYEELRRLEANARAQTRERKDLFRKAHILAPTSWVTIKHQDTEFVTDKDAGSLKVITSITYISWT